MIQVPNTRVDTLLVTIGRRSLSPIVPSLPSSVSLSFSLLLIIILCFFLFLLSLLLCLSSSDQKQTLISQLDFSLTPFLNPSQNAPTSISEIVKKLVVLSDNREGKNERERKHKMLEAPVNKSSILNGGGGGFSQLQSCFGDCSSEEELSVLPRHTKVVVTGNNRTKSVLVGLQGVVKKAVGLGGWHWLVSKDQLRFLLYLVLSFLHLCVCLCFYSPSRVDF